jgi:Ca2+-binding RTX toxin-like protein
MAVAALTSSLVRVVMIFFSVTEALIHLSEETVTMFSVARAELIFLMAGGGNDTASYEYSAAVTIDLGAYGGPRATGGDATGDTLISIEKLIGSTAADTLTGDANDNILEGRAGSDNIDGGGGTNTASYENSAGAVTVNLLTSVHSGNDAAGDTLTNIQNLRGSDKAQTGDNLTGNASNNVLEGRLGHDTLDGGAGDETLIGGAGNDTFVFENLGSNDSITSGDFTTGAASDDQLDVSVFDLIGADPGQYADLADFKANGMNEAGGNTTIELDGDDSIILVGVSISNLHADDFIF